MTRGEWANAIEHIRSVWGTDRAFATESTMEVAYQALRPYTSDQVRGAIARLVKSSPDYPPSLPKLLVAVDAVRPLGIWAGKDAKALPEPDYSGGLEAFRRSHGGLLPSQVFKKRSREEANQ